MQDLQALKKKPSTHPGQVQFPLGQDPFSPRLPHGQEPKQVSWQLNTKRLNQG